MQSRGCQALRVLDAASPGGDHDTIGYRVPREDLCLCGVTGPVGREKAKQFMIAPVCSSKTVAAKEEAPAFVPIIRVSGLSRRVGRLAPFDRVSLWPTDWLAAGVTDSVR